MTNYASGHYAEQVAAEYLKKQGYKILELNWRNKAAEIDIVAKRPDGGIVFVEVKHRTTSYQGGGLDYITPAKLKQMTFAAELWVHMHGYNGEYSLGAIELSGPDYEVTEFIVDL